jgi:FtsZ-binding cell division protein ZapB
MLEVSLNSSKKKNKFFNKYTIISILCIAVLAIVPYTNSKISEYKSQNAELKNQVENLKKQNEELSNKNNSLTKSKSELENKINSLPTASQ